MKPVLITICPKFQSFYKSQFVKLIGAEHKLCNAFGGPGKGKTFQNMRNEKFPENEMGFLKTF